MGLKTSAGLIHSSATAADQFVLMPTLRKAFKAWTPKGTNSAVKSVWPRSPRRKLSTRLSVSGSESACQRLARCPRLRQFAAHPTASRPVVISQYIIAY